MRKSLCMIGLSFFLLTTSACSSLAPAKDKAGSQTEAGAEMEPSSTLTENSAPTPSQASTSTTPETSVATKAQESTPTQSEAEQDVQPTAEATPDATPTDEPPPSDSAGSAITGTLLDGNMDKADSYTRTFKIVTTMDGATGTELDEISYVRTPYATHIKLDFPDNASFSETMIVNDVLYDRSGKEDKFTKTLPGDYFAENTVYKYDLQILEYDINYEKLSLVPVGQETVNGVDCSKYEVSGAYEDDECLNRQFNMNYLNDVSAAGYLWISNDPTYGQVLIRQRLTFKAHMEYPDYKDDKGNRSIIPIQTYLKEFKSVQC